MKTFVIRELRRQAPVAVGSLVLGLLVLAGSLFYRLDRYGLEGAAAMSVIAVLVVAPLLLGVASVAPDTETGALAFLAHLPRSLRRELVARWGVAVALAVAATSADYAAARTFAGVVPVEVFRYDKVPLWLIAIVAFATGAASSVAFRQSITALVFAPAFALPILALKAEGDFLSGWPNEVGLGFVGCGAGLTLVGASAGFLRGDLHRRSWRPLALIVGVLAGGSALASGSAFAYDHVAGPWSLRGTPVLRDVSGGQVVLARYRTIGLGERGENRLDVFATKGGKPIEIEADMALSFSPDGSKLLALAQGASGRCFRLADLATGRHEDRKLGASSFGAYWSTVSESWLSVEQTGIAHVPVAWRKGEPVLLLGGALDLWRGGLEKLPGRVESLGGTRALVCLESGERFVHDLETGARVPSGLARVPEDVKVVSAKLSADGDWVVAIGQRRPDAASLFFCGVGDERCREVDAGPFDVIHGPWIHVHVSPGRFLVETNTNVVSFPRLVDPRTGAEEVVDHLFVKLSPGGTRLLVREDLGDGSFVLDVASGKKVATDLRSVAFLDEDRILVDGAGDDVRVRDLATGRETLLVH